jgi:hypothetical protein
VLLKFFERRFGIADADRVLMATSPMIGDASRDYEDRGLICNDGGEWVNLEEVIRMLSSE